MEGCVACVGAGKHGGGTLEHSVVPFLHHGPNSRKHQLLGGCPQDDPVDPPAL